MLLLLAAGVAVWRFCSSVGRRWRFGGPCANEGGLCDIRTCMRTTAQVPDFLASPRATLVMQRALNSAASCKRHFPEPLGGSKPFPKEHEAEFEDADRIVAWRAGSASLAGIET